MLPFPESLAALLRGKSRNLSLAFDKSFDAYSVDDRGGVTIDKDGKKEFFRSFASAYRNADYMAFFKRRSASLASSTRAFDARLQSPLAIGLGLAHPTETGMLFDRLTGAVYIPGSTVKGLLRSASEQMAEGRLETPPILQPLVDARASFFGDQEKAGELVCYDAFPVTWPKLAVDIMTPHYGDYYMNAKVIPGDWGSPVPVAFLTVESGAQFRFWFGVRSSSEDGPLDQIETLLGIALDWLGVGAKKSSGYGTMSEVHRVADMPQSSSSVWKNAMLTLNPGPGRLAATKDGRTADGPVGDLRPMIPDDVYQKVRRGRTVTADVVVEPIGNGFRLVKVEKIT